MSQEKLQQPFAASARQHDARDSNWLLSTMDGKDWADEFCRLTSAADHGMMLAWFCNAIMTGYDTGRRHEAEEQARTRPAVVSAPEIREVVNRFLSWPIPASLSASMHPGIVRPIGTHLMSADETKAMFEYCLQQTKGASNANQA